MRRSGRFCDRRRRSPSASAGRSCVLLIAPSTCYACAAVALDPGKPLTGPNGTSKAEFGALFAASKTAAGPESSIGGIAAPQLPDQ